MCVADLLGTREVVTAAATAEVPDDKPPICGTVTLHCVDGDDALRLTLPMLDALLLLNSLRAIEKQFDLQKWSEQIGCSAYAFEDMAAELRKYSDELSTSATTLN
jgi:hypothetical protein